MKRLVLKFGGTSVGNIKKIQNVAKIIKKEFDAGNEIIAVVSAMSGKTNELLKHSENAPTPGSTSRSALKIISGSFVTVTLPDI